MTSKTTLIQQPTPASTLQAMLVVFQLFLEHSIDRNSSRYGEAMNKMAELQSVLQVDFCGQKVENFTKLEGELRALERRCLPALQNLTCPEADVAGKTLIIAARSNALAVAEYLLESGAADTSVSDTQAHNKKTPLHWAAAEGHTDLLRVLLKAGADPNVRELDGYTALHEAAQFGHTETVSALLGTRGALRDPRDDDNVSPLHVAARSGHLEVCRLLVQRAGSSLDAKSTRTGDTPLHWAVYRGHLPVVKYLTQRGASTEARGMAGRTPLEWARTLGRKDIADWLEQHRKQTSALQRRRRH